MRAVPDAVAASIGTDGIDGLTDVAGAWVDAQSLARAAARGLPPPAEVLARNDSFHFFSPLGDTVRTGRTDTNVGDLQVLLVNQ
jgi:glycerate 2-kinase